MIRAYRKRRRASQNPCIHSRRRPRATSAAWLIGPHIHNDVAARNRHGLRHADSAKRNWCAGKFFLPNPERSIDDIEIADEMVGAHDIGKRGSAGRTDFLGRAKDHASGVARVRRGSATRWRRAPQGWPPPRQPHRAPTNTKGRPPAPPPDRAASPPTPCGR